MDRHELEKTSAEEVAKAHLQDLRIQDRYGVKFLTYWFDEERGTGFCLIDAPDQETAQRVHQEAHGLVANDVIEVDLALVEAFLGRIDDRRRPAAPERGSEADPGFRTVMFTDIVGSTEMTARLGDAMAVEIVRAHDAIVRRALRQHGGREVKHTGDGIMASFESAPAAVACAQSIQRGLAQHNRAGKEPIRVRIGLHAGEPVEDSNDLFGATVQLAARICAEAGADRIVASDAVRSACGEDAAGFAALGPQSFKGFAATVPVFEIAWR